MRVFTGMILWLSVMLSPAYAQESLNNLPLPRWAALASGEVNMRTGPGKRYPIDWVIKKKELPVEITAEFDHWRKLRLHDGKTGWAHKSMLSGMRRVLVTRDNAALRAKPLATSLPAATMQQGVIAAVQRCDAHWCLITTSGFDGWADKDGLWGVYLNEIFE
jgi:SH3-like domain-containing protein